MKVSEQYKRGDYIRYRSHASKMWFYGRVNCVYTNGIINFTSIGGITDTRRADFVKKVSDEEAMLLKLESA